MKKHLALAAFLMIAGLNQADAAAVQSGTSYCAAVPAGGTYYPQKIENGKCVVSLPLECPSGYTYFGDITGGADVCGNTNGDAKFVACPSGSTPVTVNGAQDKCKYTTTPATITCATGTTIAEVSTVGSVSVASSKQLGRDPAYTCVALSVPTLKEGSTTTFSTIGTIGSKLSATQITTIKK